MGERALISRTIAIPELAPLREVDTSRPSRRVCYKPQEVSMDNWERPQTTRRCPRMRMSHVFASGSIGHYLTAYGLWCHSPFHLYVQE